MKLESNGFFCPGGLYALLCCFFAHFFGKEMRRYQVVPPRHDKDDADYFINVAFGK